MKKNNNSMVYFVSAVVFLLICFTIFSSLKKNNKTYSNIENETVEVERVLEAQKEEYVEINSDMQEYRTILEDIDKIMIPYLSTVNNSNYNDISCDERFSFYTDEYKQELEKENFSQKYIDSIKKNELIIEDKGISGYKNIKINLEHDRINIIVVENILYKHATDDFLKNGFLLDKIYESINEYQLVKRNGIWKINNCIYNIANN